MTKARLIKQSEILQHNETEAAMRAANQTANLRKVTNVMQTWVRQQQTVQLRNSRTAFAALFVQPQTA